MFKNYLKTAIRQLTRNRLFSALNILGLATGLCGSIFIFLWVQDELSFDRGNPQPEDIFRVTVIDGSLHAARSPLGMAPFVQRTLPVVKQSVRFSATDPQMMVHGDKRFVEKRIWFADSNFQQLFNFPLLKGDAQHIFQSKDQVLITESTAKRYFGDKDPMGERMSLQGQKDFVVAGVLKDLPANSHIQFDFLLPFAYLRDQETSFWNNFNYYSYLRLDHSAAVSPAAVAQLERNMNAAYKQNGRSEFSPLFQLQRLTEIHLGEHYMADVSGGGSLQYVRIFSLVAVFILVIACINFMNLSTALSGRRAKEVGLRKTVGASRGQLIGQFLGEAVFLALVALGLGLLLVVVLMPLFDQLTGKPFTIGVLGGSRLLFLFGVAVVAGLLSGSYPALALSAFQPVKVLKGLKVFQGGKAYFRNGLVVFQFAIAIVLIIGTLVVYRQLEFIRGRDMGFDKSNLIYVTIPQVGGSEGMQKGADRIADGMAGERGVLSKSVMGDLPTNLVSGDPDVKWPGEDPRDYNIVPLMGVDEHTLDVFGMHLLVGRFFSKAYGSDDSAVVLNEAALKLMHMTPATAVGKTIRFNDRPYAVAGVVKDFNFKPVQFTVEPLVMINHYWRGNDFVVLKTAPGATASVIAALKKQFALAYPQNVFDYGFVDKDLEALYNSEQQMGSLFNVFSVLAIFISCLGLFGLSAYTTQRRIKEIGVRKVLGASVRGIVGLLGREFLAPVALATLIAFPVSAWAMDKWLHTFAYQIGLKWWYFAVGGGLALLVALCTVSYQSFQAARANPVMSLRSE
jgi:ABC-type antimicrobial peptide transport system permease subunit